MEYVSPCYRKFMASVPFMVFLTLGLTGLPWLAYYLADWKLLALTIYGPLLLAPLTWRSVDQSQIEQTYFEMWGDILQGQHIKWTDQKKYLS